LQAIDYSNKRALIIDTSALVRSSTATMLAKLGFVQVKGSNVSSRALELVAAEDFDLVLLGHSETDRNSGLQLLEEARHKALIKPSACWGFMSADNSPAVILHASESEPDFVISKPFTLVQLQSRLQSGLSRKQAVQPINQALEDGNITRALEFCDFVLDKKLSLLPVKQKKADLLLQKGDFEAALILLEDIAPLAAHHNIELKICEALIGCSKNKIAEEKLNQLIKKSPLLIKAYDLKSKLFESSGQLDASMEVLNSAINISSKAIPRNLKLAQLACYTGKTAVAEAAYKRIIQLNDNSVHRTPEPYLGLANLQRKSLTIETDKGALEQSIELILKEALSVFPGIPELKVKIALFKSKLQEDFGNPEGAVQYRELAEKVLFLNNIKEDIDKFQNSALSIVPQYEAVLAGVNAATIEEKGSQPEISNKINLQGIKQYLNNNRAKAIKYFTMSLQLDRENGTALLNLSQVYLESMHENVEGRSKAMRMVKRYLGLIENLAKSDLQQQRFSELQGYINNPIESMPKGSLGVLLR